MSLKPVHEEFVQESRWSARPDWTLTTNPTQFQKSATARNTTGAGPLGLTLCPFLEYQ